MTVSPVRREVRVAADRATAYAVFTAHLGAWWPLGQFSVHGASASVALEGDKIVERTADGQVSVWAEVLEATAPERLRLSWHPGQAADRATDVEVTFTPDGEHTIVRLVHTGWERLADPAGAAQGYADGWGVVLGSYGDRTGAVPTDVDGAAAGERWYVLEHRPGPAAEGSVFAHPLFAEHVAFLGRLADRGLLVAAGPLPDQPGTGMTVVRVPARQPDVDVPALASTDDLSVKGGLLTVSARPWSVQTSA